MDHICIEWWLDDMPDYLSTDERRRLLQYLKDHHDAEQGINWQVIDDTARFLFKEEMEATNGKD